MASSYPTSVDNTSTLPYITNGNRADASDVNRLRDAIVYIQTELGPSPSASHTTVGDRLTELEALVANAAPDSAQYLVLSANVSLDNERVFGVGSGLVASDGGAGGQYAVELAASGVVAGAYRQPAFEVDGYGRITAVDEGTFAGVAGQYALATVEVDGYGRLVDIQAGATGGQAGKLAYWSTADLLTADGYIDADSGTLVFNNDLHIGLMLAGEDVLGSTYPVDYAVIESDAPMLISSNGNDGILFGANLRGALGANSDPWIAMALDSSRAAFTNKTAGLSFNVSAPDASMMGSSTPYSVTVAGLIGLASGSDNDGYGSAIETEEDFVLAAMGSNVMLVANRAVVAPTVTIASINGNGPAATADWHARYSDDAGHVSRIAQFIHRSDENDEMQLLMAELSSQYRPSYSFASAATSGMYLRTDGYVGMAIDTDPVAAFSYDGIFVRNGSQTRPSYAFDSGRTTGFYLLEENKKIGVTINGTVLYSITDTGFGALVPLLSSNGDATAPGLSFTSDADTGLYRFAANQIGIANGGALSFVIDAAGISGKTSPGSPWITSDAGTAALPAYAFLGNTDTGMYRSAANTIGLAAAGALIASVGSTGLTMQSGKVVYADDGYVGTPGFAFADDTNTGIYSPAADTLAIAAGGALVASFSGSYATMSKQLQVLDGTSGTPAIVFANGGNKVGANLYTSAAFAASGGGAPAYTGDGGQLGMDMLLGSGTARHITGTTSTTDGTSTAVIKLATATDKLYMIEYSIAGRRTNGTNETAVYGGWARARNIGGTLTVTTGSLFESESTAGWGVGVVPDGTGSTNIAIVVAGAVSENVSWLAHCKVLEV